MISDQQAWEFIHDLVAIPSLSRGESEAVRFVTTQMAAWGFHATTDEVGNAVGIRENVDAGGAVRHTLILLGHIDTVPGDIPVRIDQDRLYGRGSVDAKGPLAAFIVAAARASLIPGTRLIVIGAVEEEVASSKGAWHVAEHYRPDACIIGEPSRANAVTLGYKGFSLIKFQGAQSSGHSAGPETQIAEHAVAWWNRLTRYADEFNRDQSTLFEQLLLSLRSFQTASDGMSDRVDLEVGVRLPPQFNLVEFQQRVADQLPENFQVSFLGGVAAYQSKRSSPLARLFARAILQDALQTKSTTAGKVRFKLKTGTSDMNVVGPQWGCPIVAYGPGDSALDHTPQEHLESEDYWASIRVLQSVIEQQATLAS